MADTVGLPRGNRPMVPDLTGTMSFWDILATVNSALKRNKLDAAAQEFRKQAAECDGDEGMLFSLALNFIQIPGGEDIDG